MGTMNKVCAFTGHRPNKLLWCHDETDSRCVALKAVMAEQIMTLAEAGFTQFLSGMAEATNTWSALTVLSLREKNPAIKLHCILPCTAQAEKWSASSRELHFIFLHLWEILGNRCQSLAHDTLTVAGDSVGGNMAVAMH